MEYADLPKNVRNDPRLSNVCRVLNAFGFLSFAKGWKYPRRCKAFLLALFVIYVRDFSHFTARIVAGEFKMPDDVEIFTFIQTQGITFYRIYLLISHRKGELYLIKITYEKYIRNIDSSAFETNTL
jgi:hypothetical protein